MNPRIVTIGRARELAERPRGSAVGAPRPLEEGKEEGTAVRSRRIEGERSVGEGKNIMVAGVGGERECRPSMDIE